MHQEQFARLQGVSGGLTKTHAMRLFKVIRFRFGMKKKLIISAALGVTLRSTMVFIPKCITSTYLTSSINNKIYALRG